MESVEKVSDVFVSVQVALNEYMVMGLPRAEPPATVWSCLKKSITILAYQFL